MVLHGVVLSQAQSEAPPLGNIVFVSVTKYRRAAPVQKKRSHVGFLLCSICKFFFDTWIYYRKKLCDGDVGQEIP